jgi:hypothetical protein
VDELLVDLLARIRLIVDADTAAVLLLDAATQELAARAACGIEEEVERGFRVPVGTGFAGRIARLRQPVLLDRVDSTTVAYRSPENRMVGGDWYDLFTLSDGELWVVTADVAGHGLGAAVVVGRVRSVLRAYALEGGSPAEVLERTDRKVQHRPPSLCILVSLRHWLNRDTSIHRSVLCPGSVARSRLYLFLPDRCC